MVAPAVLPPVRVVAAYLVGINVFAFLAVGALAGSLAERLRSAGARLESASTEIANLQAFNQDVIDSLTSGLVADRRQRPHPVVQPRGRDDHRARRPARSSGATSATCCSCPTRCGGSWRATSTARGAGARTSSIRRAPGGTIEIGMAAAHLLTPGGKLGFLITFQDITDVKRLERDARVKQRLAAVGRDGGRHRARDPQSAGVDGRVDPGPARGTDARPTSRRS